MDQFGLTGTWYNPATSGQGMVFEFAEDLSGLGEAGFFGGWFTYGDGSLTSVRRWYSLQGNIAASDFSHSSPYGAIGIYDTQGGNFDAGPVAHTRQVGAASIAFVDCAHGALHYQFFQGGGGLIPLTHLTQSTTCGQNGPNATAGSSSYYSGAWYDPATSGQGFVMDFAPAQSALFAGWYTYLPSAAHLDGAAGQRWFTIQSHDFVPGISALSGLPVFASTGGFFNSPGGVTTTQVGSVDVSLDSCTALTLHYTFTAGDNAGLSGTQHLKRLLPAPNGCGH